MKMKVKFGMTRLLAPLAALALCSVVQASELWWTFDEVASAENGEGLTWPDVNLFANRLGGNAGNGRSGETVGEMFGGSWDFHYGMGSAMSFFVEICVAGRNLTDTVGAPTAEDLAQRRGEVTWEILRKAYESGVYVSWLY